MTDNENQSTPDVAQRDELAHLISKFNPQMIAAQIDATTALYAGDPDLQKPWEFFASNLSKQLLGKDDWSFLHIPVTQDYIDWADSQYGAFHQYEFSNSIPLWQGRYSQGPLSFYDAYKFIVLSYAIEYTADASLQAKIRDKTYTLQQATRDLSDGYKQVESAWVEFDTSQRQHLPPHRWKSYDEWYADIGSATITPLKDRQTLVWAELQSLYNQIGLGAAELGKAIANVNNDAYFLEATAPNGTRFAYPIYNVTPSLSDFVDATKANLRANPNIVGWQFQFDSQSTYRSESSTSFGAGGGFSLGGGFAVNVGGHWEEHSINTQSKNFSVGVKFAGFQQFEIKPGSWYSPSVLQLIQSGPWIPKSFVDRWVSQGKSIWGVGGLLPLQQLVAYVGLQPHITVSLETTDYSYYRRAYDANVGVSFFGIPLGGGGGHREDVTITWHDNVSSFELLDLSGKPVLVAVSTLPMPPHG
ncbi:Uncharacterised protein [Burkholderia pseudomallei]|nr:Uncharacterised protein [Burkholderia pseudomallei]CAJ4809475.1 Uncharacterised protein [Burkholderia pseudomallei]